MKGMIASKSENLMICMKGFFNVKWNLRSFAKSEFFYCFTHHNDMLRIDILYY